jgi:iron-sulfur cluster repair protein YtfE (RIC family)
MFLQSLQRLAALDGRPLNPEEAAVLDNALRYFREAAPKHTADEEASLFPRLRGIDDSELQKALAHLDRLETDHRQAEPLHEEVEQLGQKWLSEGTLAARQAARLKEDLGKLAVMYSDHIRLEDEVVFPAAASLSDEMKSAIAKEMAGRRSKPR